MEEKEFDNIELRSEKVRHIIGIVPPRLVRMGTVVITLVVVFLAVAAYTIHYPISIEAQGEVGEKHTLIVRVPYKYLYLFNEPRGARVSFEGRDSSEPPSVYPVSCHDNGLLRMDGRNYFVAKGDIGCDSSKVQVGQKADVHIVVSDKTLWQQVFKK